MTYPDDLNHAQLQDEIDQFDALLEPEEVKLRVHSPFFDDELPRLVETVYQAWTKDDGIQGIELALAVQELCEAWDEMLG